MKTVAVLAAVLLAGLRAAAPAASAPAGANPAPLSKGWGWMVAAGTVSGVDPAAGTATLTVAGQGRAATFEGGTQWRPQTVTGTQVVRMLPSTVMSDAANQTATIASVRPGIAATVWAVVRPDASVLALKLRLGAGPRQPPGRTTGAENPGGLRGAVRHAAASVLELLTEQGTLRTVLVTGATAVRNLSGNLVRTPAFSPYDVLRVEGTVNSDGSVAATRVDLEMEAAAAPRVSGSVDQVFQDAGGFVMGGVAVATAPGCVYFKGSNPGAWPQLVPGQTAVAYGTAIVSGATPVGLRAQVVAMR